MLSTLSIKNYALIESAQLNFEKGFTVITGETGAGKSILLGALGLITGKRADSSSAGDADQKCIVEGTFKIEKYNLNSFFEANDLDYEIQTIIRRELLPSGKSRAFINDTPVTLSQLQALGARIIDIHSQHKTMDVVDTMYQFEMLDTFANNLNELSDYKTHFDQLQSLELFLKELLEKKRQAQLAFDYKSFLFNELDGASLKKGEYEEIEEELNTLVNADEIVQQLGVVAQSLSNEGSGALDLLAEARAALFKIGTYSGQYQALHDRIHSAFIELEDVASVLSDTTGQIEVDPVQLEKLNTRMQLLHNLINKHQVTTVDELIEKRDKLDLELQDIQGVDDLIQKVEEDIEVLKKAIEVIATRLHKGRKEAIPRLVSLVEKIVFQLGMPNAQFSVYLAQGSDLRINGKDQLEFLFSANKGSDPKPLGKGASGGELSRLMLALKSVLSSHRQLPTLIFDEIDTGVGGDVALKMGSILKKMGHTMQLLSITHLPQIAGQGNSHFKVYKKDTDERTLTYIKSLSQNERIVEIAEMLGGNQKNTAAIAHAKNLLN